MSLAAVQPLHVAAWIEKLGREVSVSAVKQRLAGVRHLFDWLVVDQIVPVNPAASVRGPSSSVRRGKTPVLDPRETRRLLDAIDVATPIGLRDRALIGLMTYSFARDGAALAIEVVPEILDRLLDYSRREARMGMKTTRKRYSADFKAKVALEAIRGDLTLAELGTKHGIHHTMIAAWKRQAIDGMASTFAGASEVARASGEAEIDKLHSKIGQLVVERGFLAKAFGR